MLPIISPLRMNTAATEVSGHGIAEVHEPTSRYHAIHSHYSELLSPGIIEFNSGGATTNSNLRAIESRLQIVTIVHQSCGDLAKDTLNTMMLKLDHFRGTATQH
jgi:hypothetical protein